MKRNKQKLQQLSVFISAVFFCSLFFGSASVKGEALGASPLSAYSEEDVEGDFSQSSEDTETKEIFSSEVESRITAFENEQTDQSEGNSDESLDENIIVSDEDAQIETDAPEKEEETEEKENEEESEIEDLQEPQFLAGEARSVVVNNFAELKAVLTSAQQYDKVVLAGDIVMQSGGIAVHSSWTSLVIDGMDPETGEIHTFTDYNSTGTGDTLRSSSSTLKNITLQNLNVNGKNYYGIFFIEDGYRNVTITYNNVKYIGPQMSYNRYGTVRYIDCEISIEKNNSVANPQEVGEVSYVEIAGNTTIKSATTSDSMFWFPTENGSITILEGADVKLSTSYYCIYTSNSNTTIRVENNARMEYIGPYGMTYGTQSLKSVFVGENAILKAQKTNTVTYSVLYVTGSVEVQESGSLILYQQAANAPALYMAATNASVSFQNPKKVMLLSPGGYSLQYTGTGTLTATTQTINLWNTLPNGVVNSIGDTPTQIWNQQDGSVYTLNATFNTRTTSAVTTTWEGKATQWNGLLSKDTFTAGNSKNLIFGQYSLQVNEPITANTSQVSGVTNSAGQVGTYYNGALTTSTANDGGAFTIPVDFSSLQEGEEVAVLSNYDQIKAVQFYLSSKAGTLEFLSVPSSINFETTTIPAQPSYIYREEELLEIDISDTRGGGQNWRLDANVYTPFISTKGDELGGMLMFADGNSFIPLGADSTTLYTVNDADGTITTLSWGREQGILFWLSEINTVNANDSYKTVIEWSLIDAP